MTIVFPLSACIINLCSVVFFFMVCRVFHSCFSIVCFACFSLGGVLLFLLSRVLGSFVRVLSCKLWLFLLLWLVFLSSFFICVYCVSTVYLIVGFHFLLIVYLLCCVFLGRIVVCCLYFVFGSSCSFFVGISQSFRCAVLYLYCVRCCQPVDSIGRQRMKCFM
jgi:hypothetical protein